MTDRQSFTSRNTSETDYLKMDTWAFILPVHHRTSSLYHLPGTPPVPDANQSITSPGHHLACSSGHQNTCPITTLYPSPCLAVIFNLPITLCPSASPVLITPSVTHLPLLQPMSLGCFFTHYPICLTLVTLPINIPSPHHPILTIHPSPPHLYTTCTVPHIPNLILIPHTPFPHLTITPSTSHHPHTLPHLIFSIITPTSPSPGIPSIISSTHHSPVQPAHHPLT